MKDTLQLTIAELEAKGAHHYDPVRFCYIQSMARRTTEKSESVISVVERKITAALAEYQTNLESARMKAATEVNRLCSEFPDAEIKIRKLFENYEFKKIHQLGGVLDRRRRQTDISGLKDQVGRFIPDFEEKNNPLSPSSIDDRLRQQEREIVASLGNPMENEGCAQHAGKTELRSLKRFKETMAKLHADRLVTRAIQDRPENAGPHNSQMLATTSLEALRQISPKYLNRFVSHIGTLIWLKQSGENTDKTKVKKTRKMRQVK